MATEWHHMADITHATFMLAALLCIPDLITYFHFSFHAYVQCVFVCLKLGVHYSDDINYANSHQLR